MSATIINAAPMSVMQGIEDLSTRTLPAIPEALPTHLPKIYFYAQKGPTEPQLVSGVSATNTYGADTFDMRKKWANHATEFFNVINAQGNAIMAQRVEPADAGPPATIRMYLDVLPTQVPLYQRNSDGTYKVDNFNNPLLVSPAATVPGYSIEWVARSVGYDTQGNSDFGAAEPIPGNQVDHSTNVQSTMFPIFDAEVSSFGSWGNNQGIRLWAPTSAGSNRVNPALITNAQAYPFNIAFVNRPNSNTTPTVVTTQTDAQFVTVVFKPNTIDLTTDSQVSIQDILLNQYQLLNVPGYANQYGPFGKFYTYTVNIDSLLREFYAAELPLINSFSDITGIANEEYVINFVSCLSSQNVPYTSLVLANTSEGIRLTPNTTIYASGGNDGTMNNTAFGASVATLVSEYADPNSVLQDMATYPESIIYDSGYPLATKYALASFISTRKDTAVVLSAFDTTLPELTAAQESSLAIALRTHLQMYPESEFYGTSVVRAMVVGRSGTLISSQYNKPLPLTLEVANKAAKYMGASDGIWKAGQGFDSAPNNIVTMFNNINVTFTPAQVRNKDWANGLVWVDAFDRSSFYFPAFKTVYDNDTSVLNSFFTMMACVELEKVGERARRQFSGVSSLTNAQLVARVNKFVLDNTKGRFDSRFTIVPNTYFTADDIQRGYSWTLDIEIFAPNQKTVQVLSIKSYRISDLQKA